MYFVVGAIVTTLSTQVPDEVQKACKGEGHAELDKLVEVIDTIDDSIG